MKLTKISVKGFRNIKNISIELKNLLSFVSVNNYGKSNLLRSMDFALEFITQNEKIRKRMMGFSGGIPLNVNTENDNFYFQIEGINENKEYTHFKYGYEFVWHKEDNSGNKIINEWLDVKELNSSHYKKLFDRKNNQFKKDIKTKYKTKLKLTDTQLIIDFLSSFEDLKYSELINYIKNIRYNYCSLLDANPNFEPIPFHLLGEEEIVPYNDRDIPRALYFLNENNQKKFKAFKSSIFRLFPEFEDVSFNKREIEAKMTKKIIITNVDEKSEEDIPPTLIKDQLYQIFIKQKNLNQPISMERMSAGTKRVFWILLNVLLSDENNVQILAIEELETSIHPGLLKKLLEEIEMLTQNTNILISSHSTNLLQYLKNDQIYIGMPNNLGIAEFLKVKPSKFSKLNNLAHNLGMSYGEYIFNYISQCDDDQCEHIKAFLEDVND